MATRYKIILSILFVVLVAAAAVVVSGVLDVNRRVEEQTDPQENLAETVSYKDFYATDTGVALPLLKTTVEGVYYTMDKAGEVAFYELENGRPSKLQETGSFEVKASCSSQELPAVIHYIERDGAVYGCGLFTNELYPGVDLYDYGFFQVTNMFPGFRAARLLMVDVDPARFYSNDKVFSEIFRLYDDNSTEHFLSENQRSVDLNARMRTDYKMFTNDILGQNGGEVLFFSSRYYVNYEDAGELDIFSSGGREENVDNVRYIVGIASLNFWRTDSGVRYFTNTDGGFELRESASSKADPQTVETFPGSLEKDYIVDGVYLFRKADGSVYNVLTGEKRTVSYSMLREGFAADSFWISPNGRYCVFRGPNVNNVAACGVADLETGAVVAYTDEVFGYLAGAVAADDGSVVLSLASGKSGASYYQLLASAANAAPESATEAPTAETADGTTVAA